MEGFIFIVLIIFFVGGSLWVLTSLEGRVEKYIRKKALSKALKNIIVRNINRFDGTRLFKIIEVWVGTSSRIFGFSGENVFYKVVEAKQKETTIKYWVKVRTTFFVPSSIELIELD